jgi:hypothetical protein
MRRTVLVTVALLVGLAVAAGAQSRLQITSKPATIDGTISEGEYSWSMKFDGLTLYLNRTTDTVAAAVEANTTGWVAVGFGSSVMNGARIYIGVVQNGKGSVTPQIGRGHSHTDTSAVLGVDSAVKEQNGVTVMELGLKASDLLGSSPSTLPLIVAYGPSDNITQYHSFRTGLEVDL